MIFLTRIKNLHKKRQKIFVFIIANNDVFLILTKINHNLILLIGYEAKTSISIFISFFLFNSSGRESRASTLIS